VLVSIVGASGAPLHAVLSSTTTAYAVPATPRLRQVFASYGALGVEHILTGYDHVLFVVALTLLVGTLRGLLIAVTGFTLGHSLTLSLATFDVIHIPSPPIEAMIAGSIVVLAAEVAAPGRRDTLVVRAPWLVTTIFGLFHGLGFAGARGRPAERCDGACARGVQHRRRGGPARHRVRVRAPRRPSPPGPRNRVFA